MSSGPGWAARFAAALLLLGGVARESGAASAQSVVELPTFEVTDSRVLPPPESWHYAEIPGFEILSNISQGATKHFAEDFLLLQQVIEVISPGLLSGQTPVPTALVLCGRGNTFEQFIPADRTDQRYSDNSLFFQNPERAAIVVDFALAELRLDDNTVEESDPYRAFYREYFRFLIRRQSSPPPPAWFEEGLVQIFSAVDFNRKWITFAQIGDGFGAPKTGDFNDRLARRALMSMRDFLEPAEPRERSTTWSAQCYAFVHLCLYGMNKRYQAPFLKFIQRIAREPVSEALFRECFNLSYDQMALELRGYVGMTNHTAVQFTAKKGQKLPRPPPITLVDAPDAVVGRLKGEVLRLAGHGEAAHTALIAPYIRGERDPRLLAALGLDERLAGNVERSRKFLEAAAAAKVDRTRAWLELARLRLDEAKVKPGEGGKLSRAQTGPVLAALAAARQVPPRMAEVYALIAETLELSAAAPRNEDMAAIIEGVQVFPRNTVLLLQATLLAARRGFPVEARALAMHGVKVAVRPAEQERFRLLLAAIERDHPAPANGQSSSSEAVSPPAAAAPPST